MKKGKASTVIPLTLDQKPVAEILTEEIVQFNQAMQDEMAINRVQRRELIDKICDELKQDNIIDDFHVYGSFETELDLPWSDIDLVIEGKYGNDLANVDMTLRSVE